MCAPFLHPMSFSVNTCVCVSVHLHYMRKLTNGICIINCKYTCPVFSPRKQRLEHNDYALEGFSQSVCVFHFMYCRCENCERMEIEHTFKKRCE